MVVGIGIRDEDQEKPAALQDLIMSDFAGRIRVTMEDAFKTTPKDKAPTPDNAG